MAGPRRGCDTDPRAHVACRDQGWPEPEAPVPGSPGCGPRASHQRQPRGQPQVRTHNKFARDAVHVDLVEELLGEIGEHLVQRLLRWNAAWEAHDTSTVADDTVLPVLFLVKDEVVAVLARNGIGADVGVGVTVSLLTLGLVWGLR